MRWDWLCTNYSDRKRHYKASWQGTQKPPICCMPLRANWVKHACQSQIGMVEFLGQQGHLICCVICSTINVNEPGMHTPGMMIIVALENNAVPGMHNVPQCSHALEHIGVHSLHVALLGILVQASGYPHLSQHACGCLLVNQPHGNPAAFVAGDE